MKLCNYYASILFVACSLQSSAMTHENTLSIESKNQSLEPLNTWVIGGWPSGFFSNFIGVINHLLYAERNNLIPQVVWDKKFLFFEPFAPNGNAWEYYFEPISSLTYNSEPASNFDSNTNHNTYWVPNGFQLPYNNPTMFEQSLRHTCHAIIKKYIKVKPEIQKKVDAFYNQHMSSKINIGIHLRGQDKFNEVGKFDIYQVMNEANRLAEAYGEKAQIFLATDQEEYLEIAKKYLKTKIVYCDVSRSNILDKNIHLLLEANLSIHGYKDKLILGEEVLIDALLLAKCDVFIHTLSLVSQSVTYFNPQIVSILK